MDDMAAYYPPPSGVPHNSHYPYYQPPLQSALVTSHPLPPAVSQHPSQVIAHQYFPHQPPPYAIYTPPSYLPSSHDQVRTLFVAGLPEDVKPREIYNLFREFPGYESSHLRPATSSNQPFAFVVFLDQQSAVVALTELNGMVFDLEKESTLHIDLAKSNPRSKRTRIDNEILGSEKRFKGSAVSRSFQDIAGVGSLHMSAGMSNLAHNTIGYPSTQSQANFTSRGINEALTAKANPTFHITQKAAPCPTLFVASLGPTCMEHELIDLFSRCPGFLKLKMQGTYGSPVAFVDFQDTACSSEALNQLQGTVLYSSPPGEPIRLEYARSRMGMRSKKSN